ncbi:MAG: DUF4174 domain-containing protein [Rhodobacteraceae bacterium]|nr:DUF4174 domain-containing protein [Paracoccaceae bacterium]MBT6299215.1 DUF4174 domain-containing protein [Paracoccaceae bacterium]HBS37705.1 hypothetical protein [Paracoccaceae bacterium]
MKYFAQSVFAILLAATASFANETEVNDNAIILKGAEINLDDFLWVNRPIVVLADSPDDPRFLEQLRLLEERLPDLKERDVVVITDTDPSQKTDLRQALRPRGFMLVLIGKDGGIKLRKPSPWSVREISRVIDKMPMRRQEIRTGG